jgi:hypothetical protein
MSETTEQTEVVRDVSDDILHHPTDTAEVFSDVNDGITEHPAEDPEPDVFPREVVEKLRQENGKYRQRAQQADTLAERLHTELVRATGKLADPTDLPFDPEHLDDPDALAAAVDQLLTRKPHLAARRPAGDIGQGNRGSAPAPFSLLDVLKQRT